MTQDNAIQIVSSVAILLILISSLLTRKSSFNTFKYLGYWVLIILVLIFIYSFRDYGSTFFKRIYGELVPSEAIEDNGYLVIRRSIDDHYYINALVNGHRIKFLIDTGATQVVITAKDAANLGINMNSLNFNKRANTANGYIKLANTTADITIGPHKFPSFPISISGENMEVSLMGMSLIDEFHEVRFEGDVLYLK